MINIICNRTRQYMCRHFEDVGYFVIAPGNTCNRTWQYMSLGAVRRVRVIRLAGCARSAEAGPSWVSAVCSGGPLLRVGAAQGRGVALCWRVVEVVGRMG